MPETIEFEASGVLWGMHVPDRAGYMPREAMVYFCRKVRWSGFSTLRSFCLMVAMRAAENILVGQGMQAVNASLNPAKDGASFLVRFYYPNYQQGDVAGGQADPRHFLLKISGPLK
jgi:hypothetical protein